MSEQWSTLDSGCVWDIDGKLYRVIGRTGFSDGSTVDFHRADNVTESPWPDMFCDVFYVRTRGKFVSRTQQVTALTGARR